MSSLAGQVAIVTGGSGGIGRAILAALHEAGAVALSLDVKAPDDAPPSSGLRPPSPPASRVEKGNEEREPHSHDPHVSHVALLHPREDVGGEGGRRPDEGGDKNPLFVPCDVRDDASVAEAIRRVDETYGRIDIAVHAAGVSREHVVWKMTPDEWDLIHQVNLRGAFLIARHCIPVMRRAKSGRIVLIGSINGSRGKIGTSAYSASKAGLLGFSKSVAREVGQFGIGVNVIEPGWVRTEMTEALPTAIREAAKSETLMGELVEPQDVAAAVAFLCGPGGRRITGQVLRVDAGQYL